MPTPRELLAQYATQSQMSSFFIDYVGIISVKSYGAKGDGVTDDTIDVQAAVTAAVANGNHELYFPHGTYKVTALTGTSTLTFVGDNSSFTGGYAGTINSFSSHLADSVSVRDYGAKADGVTDDRAAIQAAIDAVYTAGGGDVYFPRGTYLVGAVSYIKADTTTYGACSIMLKDGVKLRFQKKAMIKVKDNAYGAGAFYRCIASIDTGVSDVEIYGGWINGNKANQVASTQCSNILIEALDNVVIDKVKSYNANGNGIMVRGTALQFATNVKILNNTVKDCTSIGIQSSQFNDLLIDGNTVDTTVNNCIDVYGEDTTTTPHGKNFVISNNTCKAGLVGIFLETVSDGIASNNVINSCTSIGITVNRINGEPHGLQVTKNRISDCPVGIRVTGVCGGGFITNGGVDITGNFINNFTTVGIRLGDGSATAYVAVHDNFLVPATNTTQCIDCHGGVVSYCQIHDNTVYSNGITADKLYAVTSGSVVGVAVGGFHVLPTQVGPILNDYVTVSTTTEVKFGGANVGMTYNAGWQHGLEYTRVGNRVDFAANISLSAKGSSTGDITIDLPFASVNTVIGLTVCNVVTGNVTFTGYLKGYIEPNTSVIKIADIQPGGAGTYLTHAACASNASFYVSGTYFIA